MHDLYVLSTIDECYEGNNKVLAGIKDDEGNWNTNVHSASIVRVGKNELKTFAQVFSDNDVWEEA